MKFWPNIKSLKICITKYLRLLSGNKNFMKLKEIKNSLIISIKEAGAKIKSKLAGLNFLQKYGEKLRQID